MTRKDPPTQTADQISRQVRDRLIDLEIRDSVDTFFSRDEIDEEFDALVRTNPHLDRVDLALLDAETDEPLVATGQAPTTVPTPVDVARAALGLISVMIDSTAAWFPEPRAAPPVGGSAHTKPSRAGSETKAPEKWQLVGEVPSVHSDGFSFELWERGREEEVRIVPGSALGNNVVHQVVMPALDSIPDPTAFPVVVKVEQGESQRLVVEGLTFDWLEYLNETIAKAQAAGDEEEVARLLPRLGFEAK